MSEVARIVARVALSFAAISASYAAQESTFAGPPALMTLPQGRAAWARAENDVGEVEGNLRLTHLTVLLKRSPERQGAFDELLRQQQDPSSPNFHKWLTATQVGEQFGAAPQDIDAVTTWLHSHELEVARVSNSGTRIEFSGTADQVGAALGSRFHRYIVDGEKRISLEAAATIPSVLSRIIQAVHGLETPLERTHHRAGPVQAESAHADQPDFSSCSGTNCTHFLAPADFATIYDINPVYQQGITGSGQTIAIIGRANVYLPDIENFETKMGLTIKDPVTIIPPNGIDPGPAQSTPPTDTTTIKDQGEATLDVQRATSVAPGATIKLVISANSSTAGGILIASEYVVDSIPVAAQVMSISFGGCELNSGSTVPMWDSVFSQGAAEGISSFVSSGDSGAAACDKSFATPPATQSASPNEICASSYATCVGGTQFADAANPSLYWSTTNSSTRGSALGYIPEGAWNEPLNGTGNIQVAASGGGISSYIGTPTWQTSIGTQGRYTPDVSFSASAHDDYYTCFAASNAACVADSTGVSHFQGFQGTSAATPSMAGIAALLNQKMGAAQGNLNPRLYLLASTSANGVFHDVTVATSGVGQCDPSVPSMCNNSTPSATALTGGLAGYSVMPGYDLVTGLGSIDVANLLVHWTSATAPGQLQMPAPLSFQPQAVGTQSAQIVATIANIGGTAVNVSNVTSTNLTEFPGTTTCITTIPSGGQCQVTAAFLPSAAGPRSATIAITSDGVGSPQTFTMFGTGTTSANYQGLWWASPANSESGWGLNFAHQGDTIFATWFTYDLGGNGNWLVMTATKTGAATYSGTLYSTSGPPFNSVPFNASQVTAISVGTGTLTFSDASNGNFAYTVGSTSQVKAITRQIFGTLPVCATANSLASLSTASNYTDLWWASPANSESGWGINLNHEGSTIFATWFTYSATGKAMWLVSTAPQTAAQVFTGPVYQTSGPPFNSVPFDSTRVGVTQVGSATFTFINGNAATFAYTVNGISQSKVLTRELFSATGTVCQ
ncbi:MAG: protease pro-enzyme activation domain-containing protein [Usitatibacter sp.]